MLTVHKIVARRAIAYADYLTSVKRAGDYYVGENGDPWAAPGRFIGRLAATFGLSARRADAETLLMLMDGRDPRTGLHVVRMWLNRDRVAAHDLVFSAPSSVSIAWALADNELRAAIQRAHDDAAAEAFAWIERTFPLVRRRDASRRDLGISALRRRLGRQPTLDEAKRAPAPILREPAAALIAAVFSHHTARQTARQAALGIPPDMQLHSHVVVPNIAQRRDGAFVAIDSLTLFRGRREAGAVYRASLAAHLSGLGFPIERGTGTGRQYFEIAGVPAPLRDCWGSRHAEIQERVDEWRTRMREQLGRDPTPAEEHSWGARSRTPKGSFSRSQLFSWWRGVADHHGVSSATIDQLRSPQHLLPPPPEGRSRLIAELLSPSGITRERAAFDMATLRTEAFQRAPGLLAPDEVEEALHELVTHEDVVDVAAGVWTTKEMLALEDGVISWAHAMTKAHERPVAPAVLSNALISAPVRLSDEQKDAVRHLAGHRFTALTGEAGVGKGVVLRVAARIWKSDGRRVFAIAVSGAQAQRLAADLGDGAIALTFDAFVRRVTVGRIQLTDRDVVALDEAGQVDSRRWHAFTESIGHTPTVALLGDHAQLSSIAAGGLWPMLAGNGPRLTEVWRTPLRWQRDAWAHLRRGEAQAALEMYARHSCVDIATTREEALEHAVAAWDADGRDGLIITDATNQERHRANRAAQALRLEHGELRPESVRIRAAAGPVDLHAGDRIIFVRQHQGQPHERRVENGTAGEVIAIDEATREVRVRTNEAVARDIVLRGDECPIDLFYSAHVYKAQGATVRRAFIVAGGWQTNKESLYVAASRSREATRLFIDRATLGEGVDADVLAALAQRASQSRAKVAAASLREPVHDLPKRFRALLRRSAAIAAGKRARESAKPYEWLCPPGRGWRGQPLYTPDYRIERSSPALEKTNDEGKPEH
jgi:AAA domain/TrwC relaxase